jgi:hypothetical protein
VVRSRRCLTHRAISVALPRLETTPLSLSLLLSAGDEPIPSRMSSAAPAKKPYRKAPPEHRELRLEIPVSRLEQEVSKAGVWPWLAEAGP